MPQMITTTHAQYQAQAIELGLDRAKLEGLKQYLRFEGQSQVVFNTPRYVRHLEQAFHTMLDRARQGEKPSPLWVQSQA
jgi:predicted O-linked N-acetylglucosamine transferase (SPINDLY family)